MENSYKILVNGPYVPCAVEVTHLFNCHHNLNCIQAVQTEVFLERGSDSQLSDNVCVSSVGQCSRRYILWLGQSSHSSSTSQGYAM